MYPDWSGRTVVVLGGGASAPSLVPYVAGRFPVIGVNRAYELTALAALYAADAAFWAVHPEAHRVDAFRICACPTYTKAFSYLTPVKVIRVHRMQRGPLGTIGHGGNSGFQAVNIAAQCGASRILLAGLDFQGDHWHGKHRKSLWNPRNDSLLSWRDRLDDQAETLAGWGIEVINLSRQSSLRKFRYVSPDSETFRRLAGSSENHPVVQ